jgi:hypothetical protein
LVFGTESVEEPGTHGGADWLDVAGVHLDERGLVIRHIGVHGANDAAIVDDAGEIRERLADFDAALAVTLEAQR